MPMQAAATARQTTFDELGTPLREVTFVVVDLETTGGSPAGAEITEIGAVKTRGGQVIGQFQTLVNPDTSIPPFITALTGITDALVASAPRLATVLPSFLEFLGDAVVVAHNAPFDVSFLKAACARTGHLWPSNVVVDTARLARQVLTRDEVPNCKLASLAAHFRTEVTPDHRALSDARATVDVLHGLIARLGNHGVESLEELTTFSGKVSPAQRRKRYLAESLPTLPGVYVFEDAEGRALYVGKSSNLRARVRNYFTAGELRSRMREMVALATRVRHICCATVLEAEVRELRLIAEHKPRYNRRSRFPERSLWVKLTREPFPRLSMVRAVRDDDADYLGPFASRRAAEAAISALHEAVPLRQCTTRLSPRRPTPACALADMGRCGAPCTGAQTPEEYAETVAAAREAMRGDIRPVLGTLTARLSALVAAERFEDAALVRDRFAALVRACARVQQLVPLAGTAELVAARPDEDGGWEISVVRFGRLAAAGRACRGQDPLAVAGALRATAEIVPAGFGPAPAASVEETECVLRWLSSPGVRLIELDGVWASPAFGAGSAREWLSAGGDGSITRVDTDRSLRTVHQPVAPLVSRIAHT